MAKTYGVSLYWGGTYGSITYQNQSAVLYFKPNFGGWPLYDTVSCNWDYHGDANYNYMTDNNGTVSALSDEQCEFIYDLVEKAFASTSSGGGGGGGGTGQEIINLVTSGVSNIIGIVRADGSASTLSLGPAIQNTPAYSLLINNQGSYKSAHCNMTAGDGDKTGVKVTGLGVPVEFPVWKYDQGGGKLGGDYDTDTGWFHIDADSVDATIYYNVLVGLHPDYPEFSQGQPTGNYSFSIHLEYKDGDTWKQLGKVDKTLMTATTPYPNSGHMNFSSASTFAVKGLARGWYRLRYSIKEWGEKGAEMAPYIRFLAAANNWAATYSMNHYWQIKGSIVSSSGGETIPPQPVPI